MRGLRNIVKEFQISVNTGRENFGKRPGPRPDSHRDHHGLKVDEFEVRKEHQVPGLDYNIYLSSGGPGDPRKNTGRGEKQWFRLIEQIWSHNQTTQDKNTSAISSRIMPSDLCHLLIFTRRSNNHPIGRPQNLPQEQNAQNKNSQDNEEKNQFRIG